MFTRTIAAAMLVLATNAATAQNSTVKIIVPFAPGGGQDVLARVIAPEFSKRLGETVIVESRAGAGGGVGSTVVARSKPDGTTLLMAASSHNIVAALDRNVTYDPSKDFTAVAHVGTGAYVLMATSKLGVKTVADLIALAKSKPGALNYASAGVGSATHLASAFFASRAGIDAVHVPYKSTAEAMNSTMAGDTQFLILPTLGTQAYLDNANIQVVAVVSRGRLPSLPTVATVDESGLPGFYFTSWFGMLGPAGMPAELTQKMNRIFNEVIALPEIAERIRQQGIEPAPMTSTAFTELLAQNLETVKGIVKAAGLGER